MLLMLIPCTVFAGADQENPSEHRIRSLQSKVSINIVCPVAKIIHLDRSSGISRKNCSS
jgi:hypothetical protein